MLKNDETEEGKSQISLIDLGLCEKFLKKDSQEQTNHKEKKYH